MDSILTSIQRIQSPISLRRTSYDDRVIVSTDEGEFGLED